MIPMTLVAQEPSAPTLEALLSKDPGYEENKQVAYRADVDKYVKSRIDGNKIPELAVELSEKWKKLSSTQTKEFLEVVEKHRSANPKFNKAMATSFKHSLLAKSSELDSYESLTTGSFGSLLNNYALAVAVEASSNKESAAIKYMEKVVKEQKGSPAAIPYSADHPNRGANARSGGARAVPFHYALWEKQKTGSKKEKEYRSNLLKSLDNYTTLLPDLIAVLGSNSAHVGKDNLAPYYFYSTLPYATAAMQKLRDKGNLTKEEKKTLDTLEENVQKAIKAVKKSKNAKAKNDEWWGAGSQGYVNPLLGLTLLPLCEKSKNNSIVD